MKNTKQVLIGLSVLFVSSMAWADELTPPPSLATDLSIIKNLSINDVPSQITYTGSPVCPEPVVMHGENTLVAGTDYTFACTNYNEAEPDGPVSAGKANIIITGTGQYSGEVLYPFEIAPKSVQKLHMEYNDHPVFTNPFVCPDVTLTDGDKLLVKDQDYEVECQVAESVWGKSSIRVSGLNNYTGSQYGPLILEMPIILDPIAIENLEFEYASQVTYTGSPVCPEFVVKDGEYQLIEGVDYTVACLSYLESETDGPVNAGKAYAVITGKGIYTGEQELYFEITPKSMKDWGFDYGYHLFNTSVCPDVVMMDGDKRLVKNKDYDVICHFGDKPYIEVVGINNYTGSSYDALSFVSLQIEYANLIEYTGSPICPEFSVSYWGSTELVKGVDYTVTCKSYLESETDGPVNAGKAYALITGMGEFAGIEEVYFEIAPKSVQKLHMEYNDHPVFTNPFVCPDVTLTDGDKLLVKDQDYEVECQVAESVWGKSSIRVSGLNNYTGSQYGPLILEMPIILDPIAIENLEFEYASQVTYTGSPVCPEFVVKDGEYQLIEGVDYTVACLSYLESETDGPVNAGKAYAVITGKGIYTGEQELYFEITPKSMKDWGFDYGYHLFNTSVCPDVVMMDGDKRLVKNKDYDVICHFGDKPYIEVVGINNYTGSSYDALSFVSLQIEYANLIEYTGSPICPEFSVSYWGSTELVKGVDYTVTCKSYLESETDGPVNAGKAYALITGMGEFAGIEEVYFEIAPKSVQNTTIEFENNLVYTGSPLCPEVVVKDGDKVLVKDIDYEVVCEDNVNAYGKPTVGIFGLGNYTGENYEPFTIARATPVVTALSLTYTGEPQELALSTNFGTVLYSTDGIEYSTEPPTATDAGSYKVTYKIEMGDNWEGVGPEVMEVTIEPKKTVYSAIEIAEDQNGTHATLDGVYSAQDTIKITEDVYVDAVSIGRVFKKSNGYSTLMLPFDIDLSMLSGADGIYEFSNVDVENAIVYVKAATSIKAHRPYLVSLGGTLGVEGGVTIKHTVGASTDDTQGKWVFKGSYGYKKWEKGDAELGYAYGFAGEEKYGASIGSFVKLDVGASIRPFRAYLVYVPDGKSNSTSSPQLAKYNYTSPVYASNRNDVKPVLPNSMDIVLVEGEQTTVIGHFNTRSGEFKMKRDYDVMGRHVKAKPRNYKAYYGKKELKK